MCSVQCLETSTCCDLTSKDLYALRGPGSGHLGALEKVFSTFLVELSKKKLTLTRLIYFSIDINLIRSQIKMI